MDPHLQLASRDDIWRLQNEMKNVYATQAEHADRLMRLERRHDDDGRAKSVWGSQSPFTSILNGTAQQDQSYNPAAEAFKNFDQDHSSHLLGSLHLGESEDEPRRGASRANSVRFDDTALRGHFSHHSRSSADFLPLRTGSGLGSHPLTERSSSHKSDGRQSSAGQSMQSARAGSFGMESRPLSATVPPFVPLGPPPGLFILGPVPSIIRCWLNTNFSNESLLYAVVCTASFKSVIGWQMVASLGLQDQVQNNRDDQETVKMRVFLPEATIQHASSRSNSPAPQLPAVTVDFVVQHSSTHEEAIQIFIGCDVLRARNADIHFSLDRLTLLDDERNKLSVPLVRPENVTVFQSLVTTDSRLIESAASPQAKQQDHIGNEKATEASQPDSALPENEVSNEKPDQASSETSNAPTTKPSVIGQGRKSLGEASRLQTTSNARVETETESLANGSTPDTPTRQESGNVWGSWRRESTQSGRSENQLSNNASSSNYQRPSRGRGIGMKVLKPARLNTSRTTSTAQQQVGVDTAPGRFSEAGKWPSPSAQGENQDPRSSAAERRFSGGAKSPLQALGSKATKSNPIGGASAFGWLNSAQQKHSDASVD